MPRLLIVGHLTIDTVCDDHLRVAHFQLPQGAALGSAVGALANDAEVDVVSVIGEDYPEGVLATLREAGVGTTLVSRRAGRSLRFWILREARDRCVDLPFESSSIARFTPAPPDSSTALNGFDAAHLCPMPIAEQLAWVERLRSEVPLISVDPQPFRYAPPGVDAEALLRHVLARIDVLSISVEDFPEYRDRPVPQALSALLKYGPRIVTLKLGALGSAVGVRGSEEYLRLAAVDGDVRDEVGAGDAFAGAFLSVLASTRDLEVAARRAALTACAMIEDVGMLHVLTRPERTAAVRQRVVGLRRMRYIDEDGAL